MISKKRGFGICLLFVVVLVSSCSKDSIMECSTGKFTEDGQCCTYVCDKECPNGYKGYSCGCECEESDGKSTMGNIFQNSGNIQPPELP